MGVIPGSGRAPGGGRGNPRQYSCLENPMHRGASLATVDGVAKSQTRLKQLSMRTCTHMYTCMHIYKQRSRMSYIHKCNS